MSIMESFHTNILESAVDSILHEHYDAIRCSLTGRIYGYVSREEIRSCLQVELSNNPMANEDSLVEAYALRYAILCTQPAPAFRIVKNHKHLLQMMRAEKNGRINIFCLVAGRLFFEHLVREQDVDSWDNRRAKVSFLGFLQESLLRLPSEWWNSLTPQDEEVTVSDEAIRMLSEMMNAAPSIQEECKAAQRCFEALLRIDGIHNLRNALMRNSLRRKLLSFRESDEFTFSQLLMMLNRLEADTVAQMERTQRSPDGNAMTFFLALDVLAQHGKRVEKLRELFEDKWRKGVAETRLSNLWSELRAIGLGSGELDETRLNKLHGLMNRANVELNVTSFSEKRRDYLESFVARRSAQVGNVQTVRGARALKDMADSGIKMKPALKEKLEAYKKAGVVGKNPSKPSKPKTESKNKEILRGILFKNVNVLAMTEGLVSKKKESK